MKRTSRLEFRALINFVSVVATVHHVSTDVHPQHAAPLEAGKHILPPDKREAYMLHAFEGSFGGLYLKPVVVEIRFY